MRTILVAGIAAAAFSACTGGDAGRFFIVQNQVPQPGCLITTERTVYRGRGKLDVSLIQPGEPFAYELFPLLQNDFPASGTANAPEPNRLFVRAFRVTVEPGVGAPPSVQTAFNTAANMSPDLLQFQVPWAGSIDPGGGLLGSAVGVVQVDLARRIQATRALEGNARVPINARVKAVGQRQDGDVESGEFVYPIEVCDGCLVGIIQACPFTAVNTGNACNPAQDSVVDCCQNGTQLVCPAVAGK
jgi:hypothetical protein